MKFSIYIFASATASIALAAPLRPWMRPLSRQASPNVDFAADPSIDVDGIYKAALAANQQSLAQFASGIGLNDAVHIFGDWQKLDGVSAFHFIADMDVDCDGTDAACPGNPDGQTQTSFGHLAASKVPYFVIPASFTEQHADIIKPNAVGAIICNGKMFYAIYGDQNGDTPEVIGEASLLLANTCFPNDGLNGNKGHTDKDVAYIVFGTQVPTGVEDTTIDIAALKVLGDKQAKLLQTGLKLSGGRTGSSASGITPSPSLTSSGSSPESTTDSESVTDSTTMDPASDSTTTISGSSPESTTASESSPDATSTTDGSTPDSTTESTPESTSTDSTGDPTATTDPTTEPTAEPSSDGNDD